ncbi:Na(+)-translocating NADH-quinone reductase subunit E [Citrobacter koseri]|uniref:Na(+)-translocating NADH-quinone reductase subunit E n=1 Tax=Citrobacter koseri TaxID=545 RepID=A0A447UVQ8_CITKO|nr:Na(+)-translocating NADH-quinone reductase subunit E [Citrobacter koseri]
MTDYLLLFVGTVLVNNFVLVKFLGLCPFMGVSKKLETAMGMGLATTFVMTLASICAWLIDTWILIPLDLIYLRTLAFILVIAVVVQFTEMVVRKNQSGIVPPAGDLPAAHHHQLRGARRGAVEH